MESITFKRGAFTHIIKVNGEMVLIKRVAQANLKREQVEPFKRSVRALDTKGYVVAEHGIDEGYIYMRQGALVLGEQTLEEVMRGKKVPLKFKRNFFRINGQRLNELRQRHNWSLSQLAFKTGIPKETLYRYEKGRSMASEENARRLVQLFGEEILELPKAEATVRDLKDALCMAIEEIGGRAEVIKEPVHIVGKIGDMRFAVVYGKIREGQQKLENVGIHIFEGKAALESILKKEDQEY